MYDEDLGQEILIYNTPQQTCTIKEGKETRRNEEACIIEVIISGTNLQSNLQFVVTVCPCPCASGEFRI